MCVQLYCFRWGIKSVEMHMQRMLQCNRLIRFRMVVIHEKSYNLFYDQHWNDNDVNKTTDNILADNELYLFSYGVAFIC